MIKERKVNSNEVRDHVGSRVLLVSISYRRQAEGKFQIIASVCLILVSGRSLEKKKFRAIETIHSGKVNSKLL